MQRGLLPALLCLPLLAVFATEAIAQTVPTLKVEIPTVTEGETGTITFTLSQAASQAIDFDGGSSAAVCNLISCPQGTTGASTSEFSLPTTIVSFAIGETTKTVSFTTNDDSTVESTEVFVVTVSGLSSTEATIDPSTPADGTGFGVPYWFIHIQDNDNPANPNVTITPGTSPVTEGTNATFTVTATPAPTSATSVSVVVSEETSGGQDFVASGNETTHTVSIPTSGSPSAGTATLTIPTVGDNTQEPHGAVTAVVQTGTGYTVGNPASATVTVTDDDGTPTLPELSIALPSVEGLSRNTAGQLVFVETGTDSTSVGFDVTLTPAPSADFTACIRVTETGGGAAPGRVAAGDEGVKAVTVPSTGSLVYTVTWTDTAADDRDSVVTVEAVAPETVGCSAASGSYTVSSTRGSDTARIEDDDPTVVALTSADARMREGDASDPATVTVGLARRLHAGEVIVVPLTLATTTGARLPGDATPDFAVSASGTGVTAADPDTATPKLTFTGHDTDTVQSATVTFTPVSGLDDGDSDHETVTATLAPDSVLGSTAGTGTTAGGGAVRHGTDFAADLTLTDDEAPATELTLTLASASAPEGSGATRDVAVTVAKPAGSVAMAYRLCFSGTATLDENGTQAAGEDYRVIHFDGSTVHTAFGSGGLAGCVGNGTVTFAANTDSHTWRVRVFGDTAEEGDETVVVTLSESANPLPVGWSVSSAGNPATHVITNDDAPPHVSLHTVDPVAVEGSTTNTAGIEVRLSGALDTGRTLTVTVQTHTDIWDVGLDGTPAGVAYTDMGMGSRQHQLVFTGPGAPTRARLELAARANTVDGDGPRRRNPSVVALHADTVSGDGLQSRNHYVELTGATGYAGATVDTGKASRQFLQVIDSASTAGHDVTLQVYSEALWRDGSRRRPEEGDTAVLIVSSTGGAPVSVTIAVQPVTADFADLGRAREGGYVSADNRYPANATGWVGYQGRDTEQNLDLYTVSILKRSPSVFMQIPIVDDDDTEGAETFRAFIYRTPPGYSTGGGIAGLRVSTVELTIPASDGRLPSRAPVVEVPDTQVANLEVTKVDADTASARWDALAHATGYEVAWDALDGDGQAITSGLHLGVTATTETIAHHTPGAASLTVTVTPEYVDGHGDTHTLADLAATATLALSTPPAAQADALQAGEQSCDTTSVKADVSRYIGETHYGTAHVERWERALAGLNGETGGMTAAGARQMKAAYSPGRWQPVVEALECLEKTAVADADAQPPVPALAIDDVTAGEGDRLMWFTVKLSPASDRAVSVSYRTRESSPVSARKDSDFLQVDFGEVTFAPGETRKRLWVYLFDDSHDEGAETFEVVLSGPRGGARIADAVGVGTIVNADPMPKAFLARLGRTLAEQALDGIAGRIAAPRTPGARGTLAGQALPFGAGVEGTGAPALSGLDAPANRFGTAGFGHDVHGFGRGFAQSRTLTGLEALLGSSFTATGETDTTGGSLALWGRAAQSSFDGREGTFSLDGETTTAMLGADYARGDWLVGLALTQSAGEGGYADSGVEPRPASQTCPEDVDPQTKEGLCDGAVREGDGDVEASLTAAVPYAALKASERLRLWGALGTGTGEVTLKPATGGALDSDITWTMAAAGVRSDLLTPPTEGSGPALALTTDALWARTSSEKTHELAASDSDVTRLRLGFEGSYAIATTGGGSLTPKVEIGARHDGGDAETGFGVELGAGIAWSDPALGLSLHLSGRTLIAHDADALDDRGFAASLAFDPSPDSERGPSLTLRQDWGGQAEGGLDALFATDPLSDRAGAAETTGRWQAEAAYGFPAFSGRFTASPHLGLSLGTGTRDYTLGWRLTHGTGADAHELSFGVKATRRESEGTTPEHAVGVELRTQW